MHTSEGTFKAKDSDRNLTYLEVEKAICISERETYLLAMVEIGRQWDYAFYVLLPKDDDGLGRMLSSMTAQEWQNARAGLAMQGVRFRFPEIETENEYDMSAALTLAGVGKAFSASNGEFSCTDGIEGFRLDKFIHKSKLSIGRTGTENAVPNVYEMDVPTPEDVNGQRPETAFPEELAADHPFAFVIAERSIGTVLFAGVFNGK